MVASPDASLADYLERILSREAVDIAHGQHVMTCLPAIDAAHRQRDYQACWAGLRKHFDPAK